MKKRVLVIGAGWSGIYSAKHALEYGFDVDIIEKSNRTMGQWHYHAGPGGVIKHTHATSSTGYMHPSDFPFPDSYPPFPHHKLILSHMENYIDHFKIRNHIHTNKEITKLEKKDGKWVATLNKKERKEYDYVIVASGTNNIPNIPDKEFSDFKGDKIHSNKFKALPSSWKGKRILIIGGGETAADIASEICNDCHVYLSLREGTWFQDKIAGAYEPADMVYNRTINRLLKWWANRTFRSDVEFFWGDSGSGVKFWHTKAPYLNGIYNKSRNVIQKIAEGQVIPKPGVIKVSSNSVMFKDEKEWTRIDHIIYATGFTLKHAYDYLPEEIRNKDKYKLIFPEGEDSIAFVGFIRPFLGSIPMIAELQSRYVMEVFSQKIKLPERNKMVKEMNSDEKKRLKTFYVEGKQVPILVSLYDYMTDIGKKFGATPKCTQLFFTNPSLWRKVIFQPWSSFQWRIHDKDPYKRRLALVQIDKIEQLPITKKLYGRARMYCTRYLSLIATLLLGILIGKMII